MGQSDPAVVKRANELGLPTSVAETQFLLMLAEGTDGAAMGPAVDEGEAGGGERPLVALESDIDVHRLMDVHLHRCVLRCNSNRYPNRHDTRPVTTAIRQRKRGASYSAVSRNRLYYRYGRLYSAIPYSHV